MRNLWVFKLPTWYSLLFIQRNLFIFLYKEVYQKRRFLLETCFTPQKIINNLNFIVTFLYGQPLKKIYSHPKYIFQLRPCLKYLLKVRYINQVDPNGARFLIFETVSLGSSATLPCVWKNIKKWTAFAIDSTYLNQTS